MILIKDLPEDIRELAEYRRKYEGIKLSEVFFWEKTPEGLDFWHKIELGDFHVYKEKYPNHEWRDVGIKETDGKVSYEEIDFEFIELMAANMSKNKDKYPPFNWQKKVNKVDLISAMLRHIRKLKHPIPEDPESAEQHLASIGCDVMMLWYQYKNYGEW